MFNEGKNFALGAGVGAGLALILARLFGPFAPIIIFVGLCYAFSK